VSLHTSPITVSQSCIPDYIIPQYSVSFTVATVNVQNVEEHTLARIQKIKRLALRTNFILVTLTEDHHSFEQFSKLQSQYVQVWKTILLTVDRCSAKLQVLPVNLTHPQKMANDLSNLILAILEGYKNQEQTHIAVSSLVQPSEGHLTRVLARSTGVPFVECQQLLKVFGSLVNLVQATPSAMYEMSSLSWEDCVHLHDFFENDFVFS